MTELERIGSESGVEVWANAERSTVEYRAPNGERLRFEAFIERRYLIKEVIGAKITTRGGHFDKAMINSRYFIPGNGFKTDSDHDSDDNHVDEYEYRYLAGQFPTRVESLCRAQWYGARFRAVVVTGPEVYAPDEPPFPAGFPPEWPAAGRLSVDPTRLSFHVLGHGTARKTVTLRNWGRTTQTVTVHPSTNRQFDVDTGLKQVRPGTTRQIEIRFRTHGSAPLSGICRIDTPNGTVAIGLTGYSEFDNR